ncbi:hypothetical protein RHSIM_Rhsim10G0131400 [Rhododendron simsii]|uniref:Uncharacterized protein n=1 Tax=Rhododendron simsii TaxID=118357 RepID=A0A834GEM2_RHOSS|nr:hypothetical protein RHSIM_Rhsim10G0131400 [Rhododendron simsii]
MDCWKDSLEEGIIRDDLWACETVEELRKALTASRLDKGKRKAEIDLTNLYYDYVELWDEAYPKLVNHVTRSGCVYQRLNLQVFKGPELSFHALIASLETRGGIPNVPHVLECF